MRLDVSVSNPLNNVAIVYLGGEIVNNCYIADEENGYVVVAKLNADGLVYVDPENEDQIARETRFGEVRIEILQ